MLLPLLRASVCFLLGVWPCLALAGASEAKRSELALPGPQLGKADGGDGRQYCQSIAVAANDAHFAWQSKQMKGLEAQLQQRIGELEAKEAEYRDVLARHDAAMKRAQDSLVGIYAHMRPDAAAAQLSALDDETAAAVLAQLNPRLSSAILNEVTPDRAVHLINAIAGSASIDGKKS